MSTKQARTTTLPRHSIVSSPNSNRPEPVGPNEFRSSGFRVRVSRQVTGVSAANFHRRCEVGQKTARRLPIETFDVNRQTCNALTQTRDLAASARVKNG